MVIGKYSTVVWISLFSIVSLAFFIGYSMVYIGVILTSLTFIGTILVYLERFFFCYRYSISRENVRLNFGFPLYFVLDHCVDLLFFVIVPLLVSGLFLRWMPLDLMGFEGSVILMYVAGVLLSMYPGLLLCRSTTKYKVFGKSIALVVIVGVLFLVIGVVGQRLIVYTVFRQIIGNPVGFNIGTLYVIRDVGFSLYALFMMVFIVYVLLYANFSKKVWYLMQDIKVYEHMGKYYYSTGLTTQKHDTIFVRCEVETNHSTPVIKIYKDTRRDDIPVQDNFEKYRLVQIVYTTFR